MNSLVEELRQLSRRKGKRIEYENVAELRENTTVKSQTEEFAKEVISLIPELCLRQASLGKNSAVIMHLDHLQNKAKNLNSVSKIVFQWCKDNNLHPTLEWNENFSDDIGRYDLTVHW